MGAATPLKLWSGILAGPTAWAFDLFICYAIVKWTCLTHRQWMFDATTAGALALVCAGALLSWNALQQTAAAEPTDGGMPAQRAKFMAMLGLTSSALFGLTVAAAWIPRWVIDACQ